MLNEVKQLGLEKFAGDEAKADEFVAGFIAEVMAQKQDQDEALEKAAAVGMLGAVGGKSQQPKPMDLPRELAEGVVNQIGHQAGNLAVNGVIAGGTVLWRSVKDQFMYNRFKKALLHAIQTSHILQSAPREKVETYADTIYRFAPMVATDPNLLQSVLTNAVHGDGVDLMTIRSLTDLENNYRKSGEVNPKTYV